MRSTKNFLAICSILLSGFFISCNNEGDKTGESGSSDTSTASTHDTAAHSNTPAPDTASAPMVNAATVTISGTKPDTTVTGTANFETTAGGKVKMTLDITVAAKANSTVAVHLHEHGDCGDSGNASHGHWNPGKTEHGKWGSGSYHAGDIGNVKLDGKGKGSTTLTTDTWTLGGAPDKNILGKALIVHSGTDDYKTQPTGNAGSRIGCGVIQGK